MPHSLTTRGAERLTGRERAQPSAFLGLAAGVGDELGDEGIGHDERRGHRRARPGNGLDREGVADVVAAGAAPGRRNRHTRQAVDHRRANQIDREVAGFVDPRGLRRNRLAREPLDRVLEGALIRSEIENHVAFNTKDTMDTKVKLLLVLALMLRAQ